MAFDLPTQRTNVPLINGYANQLSALLCRSPTLVSLVIIAFNCLSAWGNGSKLIKRCCFSVANTWRSYRVYQTSPECLLGPLNNLDGRNSPLSISPVEWAGLFPVQMAIIRFCFELSRIARYSITKSNYGSMVLSEFRLWHAWLAFPQLIQFVCFRFSGFQERAFVFSVFRVSAYLDFAGFWAPGNNKLQLNGAQYTLAHPQNSARCLLSRRVC